jgi:hypothetical protein
MKRDQEAAEVAKEATADYCPCLFHNMQRMSLQRRNLCILETSKTRNPLIVRESTRDLLICFARYAEHWEFLRELAVVPVDLIGIEVILIVPSVFLVDPNALSAP